MAIGNVVWLILRLSYSVSVLPYAHAGLAHQELTARNALFDQAPFAI
jgi:hypothetical protein